MPIACFGQSRGIISESVRRTEFAPSSLSLLAVKGNGMRGLGRILTSASQPRNLFCAALLAVTVGVVASGLLPVGPRPTAAVEARLVAELQAPGANDRMVTRIVTTLMRREHLTKHPLDDEISQRALDL